MMLIKGLQEGKLVFIKDDMTRSVNTPCFGVKTTITFKGTAYPMKTHGTLLLYNLCLIYGLNQGKHRHLKILR